MMKPKMVDRPRSSRCWYRCHRRRCLPCHPTQRIRGRLLPAGVVRVAGPFASHQAVRLVVRRRRHDDVAAFSSIDESTPVALPPTFPKYPSRRHSLLRLFDILRLGPPIRSPSCLTPTTLNLILLNSNLPCLFHLQSLHSIH